MARTLAEQAEERVEEMESEYETLNAIFQPVQAENEQRKMMLTDLSKFALNLSQRRKDLGIPTKRMGELDSAKLYALGVAAEEISELQQLVTDVSFHPWKMVERKKSTKKKNLKGSDEGGSGSGPSEEVQMIQVVNWEEPKLVQIMRKHDGANGEGRDARA